jgi:ubiquinone/menaquinone biosynthesis C-methylase UbiE
MKNRSLETHTFDSFAHELCYIRVNERFVAGLIRRLADRRLVRLLDVAAGTGLVSSLAIARSHAAGIEIRPTLLDIDLSVLAKARRELESGRAGFLCGAADHLPLDQGFDAAILGNAMHLLSDPSKEAALKEIWRVLRPGGLFAFNTTFYSGAYPEESRPFYLAWMRRAIAALNQRLPERVKSERVQAMEWLGAEGYQRLVECHGFRVIEVRERRVRATQAAVRAISSYKEFAKGALRATDEDAEEASKALQATLQATFRQLHMRTLPRNWLEIVALKA